MKNSIEAYMEFSYQGKHHTPRLNIDLDVLMAEQGGLGDLHPVIAKACDIDTYSYLYEVMEMHEIQFANATGLAAECLSDEGFDAPVFARRWQQQKQLAELSMLAKQYLKIDDLSQHVEIKDALLAAYQLGRDSKGPHNK